MKPASDQFEALTDAVGRPMRRQTVGVNLYAIVARAVEEGVSYGIQRAHKYSAAPDRETIADNVEQAVLNALCEVLDFGSDDESGSDLPHKRI